MLPWQSFFSTAAYADTKSTTGYVELLGGENYNVHLNNGKKYNFSKVRGVGAGRHEKTCKHMSKLKKGDPIDLRYMEEDDGLTVAPREKLTTAIRS